MKQRVLAQAIKRIVWANVALSASLAVPAFAQSQPAADANANASVGATVTTPAAAAPAAATGNAAEASTDKSIQKIKRFEVTGSLIRQADKTGFQSVQVIGNKQIQESGQQSVGDYLRSISTNSANSWGESTADSFAAGASGIALRGLSEKYTLVLVDGQRVAPYAFAVNASDQFFDLNTLPLGIIDRIEVVKTGAVSQYGSDAIAGVVNVITKKNYQGLTLDGSMGGATQGGSFTTKFNVLGGFGNLASDGYNVTAAASAYKDNGFKLSDRSMTQNLDYSQYVNGGSNQAPSYWLNPNTGMVDPGKCGTGTIVPASANLVAAAGAAGVFGGNVCQHNVAGMYSGSPFTERYNGSVRADFKINENTTAFASFDASYNTSKTDDGPVSLGRGLIYNPATGTLSRGPNNVIPASNPYNPYGADANFYGFVPAISSSRTDASYWHFATGIKGSFDAIATDWDWAASYGHSQSIVTNVNTGRVNIAGRNTVWNTYDFDSLPSGPGLDPMLATINNIGVSKLDVVDGTLSTPKLFTLPTGDVGFGLGVQFQHQSEAISQGANTNDGSTLSPPLQSVAGSRNVAAAYYQIDIPIYHKYLSFSQSGRYDHYSDFGGVFSPRFALRSQPIDALTMYASYNRGFRAPEFLENGAATSTGLMPVGPGGALETVVTRGNTSLQPEKTKNYNLGFVLSPTRNTDIGLDWYKIHVDKVIGTQIGDTVYDPSTGLISYINNSYQNLGSFDTSGFEATFRQALPTKYGTFTLSADWAYVWHFYIDAGDGSPRQDGAGNDLTLAQPFGGSFPRWKGNTSLGWTSPSRKTDVVLSWEYTGPYSDTLLGDPSASTASYSQFDLNFTYTGIKHLTIYGGINNIFDRRPPFDPLWIGNLVDVTGYDQSLYTNLGRYIQVGATYKF